MTLTWDDSKETIFSGSYRGGLRAPKDSLRTRIIKRAQRNGWRLEPTSGEEPYLVHEDGTRLRVYLQWYEDPAILYRDGFKGVRLTREERDDVLDNKIRCTCTEKVDDPDYETIIPSDTCPLSHHYEHEELGYYVGGLVDA